MKPTKRIQLLGLAAALLAAFLLPSAARADDGLVYGETIPAGVVIDRDVILVGRNVSIAGTVNGNVFILGNQVLIDGKVDGNLVLIAQNAAVGGEVSGTVYSTALTIDLPRGAALGRDLYAFTVSLTSKPESRVGRHLYALGLDAGLNGEVGGELRTMIGPIQVYNGLMRLLGFEELTLELHFEIPEWEGAATQGSRPAPRLRLRLQEPLPAFDWNVWGLNLLRSWGVLFGFGLLLLWLARLPLERAGIPLMARPWRTLGLGLPVLVVSLNLFLVALLLFALVFALGLGLNALSLWPVTAAVWVLAYSCLAIALTLLWLFIVCGTKIIVSYHAVNWVIRKFDLAKSPWMDVLIVLLGTLLYSLLRTIPYVGWGIGLLVIAAGMGTTWVALRSPAPAWKPARGSRR